MTGIHDYDDTLGDISAEAFKSDAVQSKRFVRKLEEEVDPSSLDLDTLIDYRVAISLASANHLTLDTLKQWMTNPGSYPLMAIWGCYGLIQQNYAPMEDRLRSVLCRMREIPEMLNLSKRNIAEVPAIFAHNAIEVTQGGVHFFGETLPIIAESSPLLKSELISSAKQVVRAFREYETWLRKSVLPTAGTSFAIGGEAYRQLLFSQHYITYNPGNLVSLAETMLEQAVQQIEETAAMIDPSVTWKDLIARLSQDHPPAEGLVGAYRDAMDSARQFVIDRGLATLPDDEHLEVVETPLFERSTLPYAAYYPPAPFDCSKIGRFWVTPIDTNASEQQQKAQLAGHCTYTMPVRSLHEGYPGHHLQLSRVVDITSPLRKQSVSSLLTEGWALYAERMMREEGFYTDARVRLFQIKDVIWRACRVIIDVGLHTADMSFDDAVHMLVDKVAMEEVSAVSEVTRYAMTPTQPMTYAIGALLIQDMRDRVKHKLRGRFDLRAFHDELLGYGSIPPPLIALGMISREAQAGSYESLKWPAA